MHQFSCAACVIAEVCRRKYRAVLGIIVSSNKKQGTLGLAPIIDIEEYDTAKGIWRPMSLVSDQDFDRIYKALCQSYAQEHQQEMSFFACASV